MGTQVATHRTYEEKIAWAMSTIKERDGYVVIASESEDMDHIVLLNENFYSIYCTCKAGKEHSLDCYHRIATDRHFDSRRPSFHQMCGISDEPFASYDVVGAALKVFNQATIDTEIGNSYEQLAQQYTYCPSCGKLKRVNDQDVCGFCMVGGVA